MEADKSSDFGINLIAYIRAEIGLGTAARGLAMAFESAKIPFNIINFEHSNPALHRDRSWQHKEVERSSLDFTVLAVNPDNLSNARMRAQKEFVRDRYTIGYWFWELPEIPDDWLPSFALVDEVWTGSRFVQDAISLKSPVPVFRVPVPVRLGPTNKFSRKHFGLPERKFLFLAMSDTHSQLARKNPLGVIHAFKKAFPRDSSRVGLVLKINNVNSVHTDSAMMALIRREIKGHRNIYLLDRDMMRAEVDALLALTNCFVSLHRSEGFGLGPAEAMSLGKPVILTNWSGNTDYMTRENSIGIDYELIRVGKQYGPYPPEGLWADPDLKQAAFWMKQLVKDPELVKRMGKLAKKTIRQEFSPEAVGKLIHGRLSGMAGAGIDSRTIEAKPADQTITFEASPNQPSLAPSAFLTIYSALRSGYSEDRTIEISYQLQRWSHMHIALEQGLGVKPLRLDPLKMPGLIDIAGMALKSAVGGEVLWRANGRGGLETLEAGGSAIKIPHGRLARIFSYGEDPQVYLPLLTGPEFDGPLRLELWLKVETGTEAIGAGLADLAAANARAVAQIGETQKLLETTARDESDREAASRESLDAALREQAEALAEANAIVVREKAAAEGTIAWLTSELNRAREQLNQRTTEGATQNIELERARTSLGIVNEELQRQNLELAQARQELSLLTREVETGNSEREQSRLALAEKSEQIELLRKELQARHSEMAAKTEQLSRMAERLERTRKEMNEEIASERSVVHTLETELASKQGAVDDLTRELDQARNELLAGTQELTAVAADLATLKGQFVKYKEEAEERLSKKASWPSLASWFSGTEKASNSISSLPMEARSPARTFWLEHPTESSDEGEPVVISGWALSPTGGKVEGIRALINGQTFVGQHGFERKDVAAAQADNPNAGFSGFRIEVALAMGVHNVFLERLSKGGWERFCAFQHEVRAGERNGA
jgi:glycosyltransferase involved in cell wall biosynthesis